MVTSSVDGWRRRQQFAAVETYCLFVGYPRSGKSLLRSLLGAHPEIVLSDEFDALRYVQLGFRRNQLYSVILRRARAWNRTHAADAARDFLVTQASGATDGAIRVIGHNKGGATTLHLQNHPEWLGRFASVVGVPVRLLHVVRNPFDNIGAIAAVRAWGLGPDAAIDFYRELVLGMSELRASVPSSEILDVRHEGMLREPAAVVASVCGFLGVDAPLSYLETCARSIRPDPERAREHFPWTPPRTALVEQLIADHDFLRGYTSLS